MLPEYIFVTEDAVQIIKDSSNAPLHNFKQIISQKKPPDAPELILKITCDIDAFDKIGTFKKNWIHVKSKWFYLFVEVLSKSYKFRTAFINRWTKSAKQTSKWSLHKIEKYETPSSEKYNSISSASDNGNIGKSCHSNAQSIKLINIVVIPLDFFYIDKRWCGMLLSSVQQRVYIEETMSWLSTLGGACSALGDSSNHWAEKAYSISYRQMVIAWTIGDPNIISRCYLYAAIAAIQKNKFKAASRLIRQQYQKQAALEPHQRDVRLIKMCLGIWEKLSYTRKQYAISG